MSGREERKEERDQDNGEREKGANKVSEENKHLKEEI